MRLSLNDEPSFEEIQGYALELFGSEYWEALIYEDEDRIDMEHAAEQQMIRDRLAAKQADFA